MNISQLQYAQKELAEIREFCQANSHLNYDEMFDKVYSRVNQLEGFCANNNIPLVVSLHSIVEEFCASDYIEESSYYEEYYEESSYYEEEEEEEEEEEYSSYYEDEEDSSY